MNILEKISNTTRLYNWSYDADRRRSQTLERRQKQDVIEKEAHLFLRGRFFLPQGINTRVPLIRP